jgi:ABC-type dipeptide/oligopeptide/nickel transport system permease component
MIGSRIPVVLIGLSLLLILGVVPCKAQSAGGISSLRTLAAERAVIRGKAAASAAAKEVQTIRYSGSAQASNMILPAILLGLPSIVVLALIIRAMKGD